MSTAAKATYADLSRTEGKAELIGGKIIRFPPHSWKVGVLCGNLISSLHHHAKLLDRGIVGTSTMAYVVPMLPSGRESFCPYVSFHLGPLPIDRMKFIEGSPTFAVEVRDAAVSGGIAEVDLAAKRADYFAAGTLAVWDVDPVAETVACYRQTAPTKAIIWRRGDTADAEPAVPGWRITVDEVFA
jgi:Uma2 family endonuclease